MTDTPELILRADAESACQNIADEAKAYNVPQMAMGAITCRDAIALLPAAQVGALTCTKCGKEME